MPRIGRTYRFEAAHFLPNVPKGHKCRAMHGHTYRLDVELTGKTDARGFVVDFAELDLVMEPVLRLVDHHILNDVQGLENPTAELIAQWFHRMLSQILERTCVIRVYENADMWAEVAG